MSSTGPSSPTPTANKPRRLDTEAQWAEMRRYIGLDVLNRSRLATIEGGADTTTTNIPEVTTDHALSA